MIERHHFLRLHEPYRSPEQRRETARRIAEALTELPGVLSLRWGLPADENAGKDWDLSLTICFQSLADVETYRAHRDHRRFVDEYLAPRLAEKKIWNFEVPTNS